MKFISTTGLLIDLKYLTNDDALLVFITPDLGCVKVFANKLGNSIKRKRELDFFRLLSLDIAKIKQSWKLKKVSTIKLFPAFQSDYEDLEIVSGWLKTTQRFTAEEKTFSLFPELLEQLENFQGKHRIILTLRWHLLLLDQAGILAHNHESMPVEISLSSWKTCRFLLKKPLVEIFTIAEKIPQENIAELQEIIFRLEQDYH